MINNNNRQLPLAMKVERLSSAQYNKMTAITNYGKRNSNSNSSVKIDQTEREKKGAGGKEHSRDMR